jgi:chitinase
MKESTDKAVNCYIKIRNTTKKLCDWSSLLYLPGNKHPILITVLYQSGEPTGGVNFKNTHFIYQLMVKIFWDKKSKKHTGIMKKSKLFATE